MNALKKVLIWLLSFLFFNLIAACILSYTTDRYLQKDFVSNLIKETLKTTVVNMTDLDEEQEQQMQEIFEAPEAQELIESINDELLNSFQSDGNIEINPEMFDEVFNYILENKEAIEAATNSEIDLSEIEDFRNSEDYQNIKNNMTENINNSLNQSNSDKAEKAINYYSLFISNKFRIYVLVLSAIDLACIALLQNSNYKWLKIFGKAIIMCGFTVACFYCILLVAINVIENKTGVLVALDYKSLFMFVVTLIVIGILSLVVYRNLKKNDEKSTEYY